MTLTDEMRAEMRKTAEATLSQWPKTLAADMANERLWWLDAYAALLDERDRLERERNAERERTRVLEDALIPFALWAKHIPPSEVDHARTTGDLEAALPQVGYIRRAARVLARPDTKGEAEE